MNSQRWLWLLLTRGMEIPYYFRGKILCRYLPNNYIFTSFMTQFYLTRLQEASLKRSCITSMHLHLHCTQKPDTDKYPRIIFEYMYTHYLHSYSRLEMKKEKQKERERDKLPEKTFSKQKQFLVKSVSIHCSKLHKNKEEK